MGRINLNEIELNSNKLDSELDSLILAYVMNKTELDSYDSICKSENKRIKELMLSDKLDSREVGGYKATLSTTKKETFKEELLKKYIIEKLWGNKGSMTNPYLRMEYVIDYDALEKAIYNGVISKEELLEMEKFKEVKEVQTLRITKIKNKKEN